MDHLTRKIKPGQVLCRDLGDIRGGDLRDGHIPFHRAAVDPGLFDQPETPEVVFHEVGGPQMHDMNAGDFIQALFMVIKPIDRAQFIGPVGAQTA